MPLREHEKKMCHARANNNPNRTITPSFKGKLKKTTWIMLKYLANTYIQIPFYKRHFIYILFYTFYFYVYMAVISMKSLKMVIPFTRPSPSLLCKAILYHVVMKPINAHITHLIT